MVGFNRQPDALGAAGIYEFTFHYGRIQSRSHRLVSSGHSYLHSIMVGFNLSLGVRHIREHIHLHSIMVGFNPAVATPTLTHISHLHSIMVGFNPSRMPSVEPG